MAYNEKFADRVRELIAATEKKVEEKQCLAAFALWSMIKCAWVLSKKG